jgi:hypothetical protein
MPESRSRIPSQEKLPVPQSDHPAFKKIKTFFFSWAIFAFLHLVYQAAFLSLNILY